MKLPKIKPLHWIRMILEIYEPMKEVLRKVDGNFIEVVRSILDLMGVVEDLFPENGNGDIKLRTFLDLFLASTSVAGEAVDTKLEAALIAIVSVIKSLLKSWGYFAKK